MVAHQILDLLVLVRIQVGLQAFATTETLAKAFFILCFARKSPDIGGIEKDL